jgi:hypothetical protein
MPPIIILGSQSPVPIIVPTRAHEKEHIYIIVSIEIDKAAICYAARSPVSRDEKKHLII